MASSSKESLKKSIGRSVGKKFIMAMTGLFLLVFLLIHLIGNSMLIIDPSGETFNAFVEGMTHNPMIRIMEFVLLFGFIFHIIDAIVLKIKNRQVRSVRYKVYSQSANSKFQSRTMLFTGLTIFSFLLLHIYQFVAIRRIFNADITMFDLVRETFKDPIYIGIYILAFILLSFHLNHGFESAFQTFGLNSKKYTPILKRAANIYSYLVPAGFTAISIFMYIN
ncbi:MAG: succinate dehydrogenase cytochrome b subunit [Spirochaetia bacterium]|nr:succinate dehydrogenase cytochrome b subunit [Spirochaetia bacterium]